MLACYTGRCFVVIDMHVGVYIGRCFVATDMHAGMLHGTLLCLACYMGRCFVVTDVIRMLACYVGRCFVLTDLHAGMLHWALLYCYGSAMHAENIFMSVPHQHVDRFCRFGLSIVLHTKRALNFVITYDRVKSS